jgi:hypothetical protein
MSETLTLAQLAELSVSVDHLKVRRFLAGKPHVLGVYMHSDGSRWALTIRCYMCNEISFVELEHDALLQWASGTFIQNIWPDVDLRERLMSGTDDDCFQQL